ncbi:hypothetical protein AgCh_036967 [Apium graveolens]
MQRSCKIYTVYSTRNRVPAYMAEYAFRDSNNESVKGITSKFAKLDKFEGHDFRRWQKKMHFLLTTLKVVYVLSTPMQEMIEEETVEQTRRRCKWENDDYICRGHILNGMSDSLFDIYQNVESAKELWDSLESKYMAEDASSKKFLDSNNDNGKKRKFKENNNTCSNKKPKLACWKCSKPGHFKKDCRVGKGKHNAGPSGSKDLEKQQGSRDEVEIESEYQYCFIIEEDPKAFNEAMTSRDVAFWKEAI